jgi:hypothetical protein
MSPPDWLPFKISFEKECNGKICYAIVTFYTNTIITRDMGSAQGFAIDEIAYADAKGNACDCSPEDIMSEAVTQIIDWMVKWKDLGLNDPIAAASISTCYYKAIGDIDNTKTKKELHKTGSKYPPYLDGNKKFSAVAKSVNSITKIPMLKPCDQQKCCVAYYEIIWNIDELGKQTFGGFKFKGYSKTYEKDFKCNLIECKPACGALKVDQIIESSGKIKTTTTVVPNPSDGRIAVHFVACDQLRQFIVVDNFGNEVYRAVVEPNAEITTIDIDLKCSSGLYIYKVIKDNTIIETGNVSVVK